LRQSIEAEVKQTPRRRSQRPYDAYGSRPDSQG
jgi:hypothetical protein